MKGWPGITHLGTDWLFTIQQHCATCQVATVTHLLTSPASTHLTCLNSCSEASALMRTDAVTHSLAANAEAQTWSTLLWAKPQCLWAKYSKSAKFLHLLLGGIYIHTHICDCIKTLEKSSNKIHHTCSNNSKQFGKKTPNNPVILNRALMSIHRLSWSKALLQRHSYSK